MRRYSLLLLALISLDLHASEGPLLSGGATTVFNTTHNAFSLPAANMPMTRRGNFFIGNSFATKPWVAAPASTKARDGLGPVFNANSCQSCHAKDGRGKPPEPGAMPLSLLVKVSLPSPKKPGPAEQKLLLRNGVIPEPHYGAQITPKSIPGVTAEPMPVLAYEYISGEFADGEAYSLRKPVYTFSYQPGQKKLNSAALFSARVAPVMVGMGLLEAIPEKVILKQEDPLDQNKDGISGRANRVWNQRKQQTVLGRFGWKAGNPTVEQQVAGAFVNDMGLTTSLFTEQTCMPSQSDCLAAYADSEVEVSDEILDFVVFYSKTLAVPARRDINDQQVQQGAALFASSGCQACHVAQHKTAANKDFPELSNQHIWPYTDLLLHDMGEGLADHRDEFLATGKEWRTPPLWGIGLVQTVNRHTQFLHDGRARNLMEAVLWHAGEAKASREKVLKLSKKKRIALIKFLESL